MTGGHYYFMRYFYAVTLIVQTTLTAQWSTLALATLYRDYDLTSCLYRDYDLTSCLYRDYDLTSCLYRNTICCFDLLL